MIPHKHDTPQSLLTAHRSKSTPKSPSLTSQTQRSHLHSAPGTLTSWPSAAPSSPLSKSTPSLRTSSLHPS